MEGIVMSSLWSEVKDMSKTLKAIFIVMLILVLSLTVIGCQGYGPSQNFVVDMQENVANDILVNYEKTLENLTDDQVRELGGLGPNTSKIAVDNYKKSIQNKINAIRVSIETNAQLVKEAKE